MRRKAAGKELLERAKQSRANTNRAFAELADELKKAENPIKAIVSPVSQFLVKHCGFKEDQPLPMWDELFEALEKAVDSDA